MSALTIEELPTLTNPALIVAFAGWNGRRQRSDTRRPISRSTFTSAPLASLDPEEFYNFSELRPQVRLRDGLYRERDLASQRFSLQPFCYVSAKPRDGYRIEPHLKWKTYAYRHPRPWRVSVA